MGYEGERQRQITNGWYMRGTRGKAGEWSPEPGLPGDVLVYGPMGATYEREMYPDKGFLALSEVPNKKAVAGRSPDFAILPPKLETLQAALAKLWDARELAKARTAEELEEVEAALGDPAGLMKGESAQLRKVQKALRARLVNLDDERLFDPGMIYRQMVAERQEVLKAQMSPEAARQAELEREHRGWEEELNRIDDGAALARASTSRATAGTKSMPTEAGSREN